MSFPLKLFFWFRPSLIKGWIRPCIEVYRSFLIKETKQQMMEHTDGNQQIQESNLNLISIWNAKPRIEICRTSISFKSRVVSLKLFFWIRLSFIKSWIRPCIEVYGSFLMRAVKQQMMERTDSIAHKYKKVILSLILKPWRSVGRPYLL